MIEFDYSYLADRTWDNETMPKFGQFFCRICPKEAC